MSHSESSYLQQLKALLPRGTLWDRLREPGSLFGELLAVFAAEFSRIEASNDELPNEADPRATYQLLPEWEAFAQLPTPCAPSNLTLAERRTALLQRLTGDIPNDIPGIEAMAASLGVPVTITEHRASRYGSRYGSSYAGIDWQFTWDVVAPATTVIRRRHGDSYGGAYAKWGYALLECAIRRVAPAGFVVRFIYA